MYILLSNDDGYQAPGLIALATALQEIAEISVVAPDRDRSGASNSLTLDVPLRAIPQPNGFIRVNGTPTDCVHLALTQLLPHQPDFVIAGINAGPNLGDDVLYSGTVAAAMEGRVMGIPALAVSLAGRQYYYHTAAHIVKRLVLYLAAHPLPGPVLLNINVPDVAEQAITGFVTTRLGSRHKAEPAIQAFDPLQRPVYWIGPPGAEQDAGPGTDFYALQQHQVSITPLKTDLTDRETSARLPAWDHAIPSFMDE